MMTAVPHYVNDWLDSWLSAVGAPIPLPPHRPWTCLLHLVGPSALLWRDDKDVGQVIDRDLAAALLHQMGRPTRAPETLALLLVTPVPANVDLARATGDLLEHTSFDVRHRAALLIGCLDLHSAADRVYAHLSDSDDDVRQACWQTVGRLGTPHGAQAALDWPIWDAHDAVNAARFDAISRLGLWSRLDERLRELPEHPARSVAQHLCAATKGDAQSADYLVYHDIVAYRRSVFRALSSGECDAAAHDELLVSALFTEVDEVCRDLIVRALGTAGTAAAELLYESLAHDDPTVRAAVCAALAELGEDAAFRDDATARRALQLAAMDRDESVAANAVLALHRVGDTARQFEGRLWAGLCQHTFFERAARLGDGLRSLVPLRSLYASEPAPADLVHLVVRAPHTDLRRVASYVLADQRPDLAAQVMESLVRNATGDVQLQLRRDAAAAMMLTGHAPQSMGCLHQIALTPGAVRDPRQNQEQL
ncbi:MAG: hypothetical protein ACI9MC_001954, partial [Kiritimatiellia bacterium]